MTTAVFVVADRDMRKWTEEGRRLKAAREQAGLTQDAVAEALGVNRHVVWYWEVGRSFPTPEHLRQIADLYGISVDWLLGTEVKRLREAQATYSVDDIILQEVDLFLRAPGLTQAAINEVAEYLHFKRDQARRRNEPGDSSGPGPAEGREQL